MASFEAKIGWKRSRKREIKNYRSVPNRCVIENSKKIAKFFKKLKKTQFQRHSKPKLVGKGSERENKNYPAVSFLPNA